MVVHQRHAADLSMPQFRAMKIVYRNKGASLSLVADRLGITLSAASKLIDNLVERRLLTREPFPEDRRRVVLAVTEKGQEILAAVHQAGVQFLAEKLAGLSEEECRAVEVAMNLLTGKLAGILPSNVRTENGGEQCR
jgi:DNA-binding MarR family transcriptional regulator